MTARLPSGVDATDVVRHALANGAQPCEFAPLPEPLFFFNPLAPHAVQREIDAAVRHLPGPPAVAVPVVVPMFERTIVTPAGVRHAPLFDDDQIAELLAATDAIAQLPISPNFRLVVQAALDDLLAIARRRLGEADRRARAALRPQREDWRTADLVAEVEAACGPGRKRGREWWFRCAWHEDRTPSLHVDAERRLWRCFSCSRGGGVIAWRRTLEAA